MGPIPPDRAGPRAARACPIGRQRASGALSSQPQCRASSLVWTGTRNASARAGRDIKTTPLDIQMIRHTKSAPDRPKWASGGADLQSWCRAETACSGSMQSDRNFSRLTGRIGLPYVWSTEQLGTHAVGWGKSEATSEGAQCANRRWLGANWWC